MLVVGGPVDVVLEIIIYIMVNVNIVIITTISRSFVTGVPPIAIAAARTIIKGRLIKVRSLDRAGILTWPGDWLGIGVSGAVVAGISGEITATEARTSGFRVGYVSRASCR